MALMDSLRFHVSFFIDSIPLIFNTLTFFCYSLLYNILRLDPAAPETNFSILSLPSPKRRTGRLYPHTSSRWDNHEFRPPGEGDVRSPCPALNTMANHGYIPRNGKNLTGTILTQGLMECYNLSWPLAAFLSWGGVILLGQVGYLSLHDLARHNRVEHDASLTHPNTHPGEPYAPIHSSLELFEKFIRDAKKGKFSYKEIAHARVRRENGDVLREECLPVVTSVQQEIARGEVALVLQIFGGADFAVPVEVIRKWWWEQRLPDNWKPTRTTTLLETIHWSSKIRHAMDEIRSRQLGYVVEEKKEPTVDVPNGKANVNGINGFANGLNGYASDKTSSSSEPIKAINGIRLSVSHTAQSSEDENTNPRPSDPFGTPPNSSSYAFSDTNSSPGTASTTL